MLLQAQKAFSAVPKDQALHHAAMESWAKASNAYTRNCPIHGEGSEAAGHASREKLTISSATQCSLSTVLVGDTTSLPSPSHQLHQHHHHYFFSACGTTTREGDIPCHRPHVPARLSWATSRIALSASRRSTPVRAGRTSTGNQGSIGHRRFSQFDVVPF